MEKRNSILLSIGAMVIMLILYALSATGVFGDNPVGQTGSFNEPLIVPEPYAFAIWGLIYTGLIVFPFVQLIKNRVDHPAWDKIRMWYSLNVVANGLWLVCASYDWLILSVLIILFMLVSLWKINVLFTQLQVANVEYNYLLEKLVFGVYFAWITLATVLNIAAALAFYQWGGLGIAEVTWSLIILPIAAIIASLVFFEFRDKSYAAVVVWAFAAIVVKHLTANPAIAYLSIGVAILFLGYIMIPAKVRKVSATN